MTRIVVMDQEMTEPLTVVEISERHIREAEKGGYRWINLPVPGNLTEWTLKLDKIPEPFTMLDIVRLRLEPIWTRDRILFWVAVPNDEVLALLLRAAFLPGQINEVQRREAVAWISGALQGGF
jgi:hypothetical protein